MKNLLTRSITGSIYVILLVISLLLGKFTFGVFFLIISIIAINEFYKISKLLNFRPLKIWGYISTVIVFLLSYLINANYLPSVAYIFILFIFLTLFIVELIFNYKINEIFINISINIFAFIYIILPISLLPGIAFINGTYSHKMLLYIFILICVNDTMAYVVGMILGKHKIHKEISPKKSWEGFFGGLIFTFLVSYVLSKYNFVQIKNQYYIPAIIIPIFGTTGDFFESLLKRKANIKDSGNILPGHGGILDRIDSLLFIIPVIYIWLKFFIT